MCMLCYLLKNGNRHEWRKYQNAFHSEHVNRRSTSNLQTHQFYGKCIFSASFHWDQKRQMNGIVIFPSSGRELNFLFHSFGFSQTLDEIYFNICLYFHICTLYIYWMRCILGFIYFFVTDRYAILMKFHFNLHQFQNIAFVTIRLRFAALQIKFVYFETIINIFQMPSSMGKSAHITIIIIIQSTVHVPSAMLNSSKHCLNRKV